MRREVKETIRQFYDDNVYINPNLGHPKWRYKQKLMEKTRAYVPPLIEEIRNRISTKIRLYNTVLFSPGGGYDYSEGIVIDETVILRLSWLGPFATYDYERFPSAPKERAEEIKRKLRQVLEDNDVIILSHEEVDEPVDWVDSSGSPFVKEHFPAWNCLFCEH